MKLSHVMLTAAGFLLCGLPASVDAAFVVSGYSIMSDANNDLPPDLDEPAPANVPLGVVNFAVFENTGTVADDAFLTSLGFVPATTADYLYLYQIVNTGASTINTFNIGADVASVEQFGWIAGAVFTDAAGAISVSNPYIGTVSAEDPSLDGLPTSAGEPGAVTGTTTNLLASSPVLATLNPPPSGGNIFDNPPGDGNVAYFFFPPSIPTAGVSSTSSLLFLTSDTPYAYLVSAFGTYANSNHSYNELPAPSTLPLPTSIALLASGVPGLLGLRMFLRRKQGNA